ncbi:hypothetical protein [Ktedonospora formicarum]|uniref:TPM domain-containing protein n=1 Tax=Ktedonospora formicarum TaxID=2778364 RepID=A0A8J3HTV4_9CHLR|nr:hypothetical protein [Ktedonospora formicarum]GHO43619.1 hypothetical protein KSX_17820 [Ktedonospora formicarum]
MRREKIRPFGDPHLGKGLVAFVAALSLVFMTSLSAFAGTARIYDNAGVLDRGRVMSEAQSLPYNLTIYTINNFSGSKSAFQNQVKSKVSSKNEIVMAILTTQHYLWFAGGSDVKISSSQYTDATKAFSSNFGSNNYTNGTIAAIGSLRNASGGNFMGIGGGNPVNSSSGLCCCIGLIALLIIGAFVFARRRRGGGGNGGGFFGGGRGFGGGNGWFGRRNAPPPGGYGYDQYGQPYPPNYNQGGGGMNPWAAGGLGAAAGGLLGYELGRNQGEHERRDEGYNDNNGDFGGGNEGGGDFGGGNDWGGGDSGGGGDWGGGGGDFGGGSDWGGGDSGGGGGDF